MLMGFGKLNIARQHNPELLVKFYEMGTLIARSAGVSNS
jgi:hypothetical protein